MHLRKEVDPEGRIWVSVAGRVTQSNIDKQDDPIDQVIAPDGFGNRVLIDLSEVVALDSSGVNWLLMTHKRIREAGGRLVLHSLSPIVRNVFKVLNLQTVFELAENRSQATTLVEENPS